nr:histidine kinase [Prevotella sp.]
MKQTIHHRQQAIFTYIFLLLSSIAFLAACQRDNCKDEKRAYSLFLEAVNYNADGDKKQAILLIDSALNMNCADTTRSWLTSEKLTAYTDLGQMREAIEIGKKGIPFAEKIEDYDGMLAMCGAMGICYRRIGELDSSLIYYKKGIQKAIKSENAEYEIYLYNCISVLFNEQKRFREAIEYSDKAESKAIAINDTIERLSAHANKGAILMRQGNYRKSVNSLTSMWNMVKQTNYNVLTLKYLSPLLKSYLQLGKADSVTFYLTYANEACRNLAPTSNGVLGILEIKADLLGQQKKYAEQWLLLDSIGRLAGTNLTMPKDKLLATQARCLNNMGKYTQAYQAMQKAYMKSDSLKQSDIDKQLSEFNIKYKTLEKEMLIEKMNHEQSLLYIRILWLILALIILLIAILVILYRRKLDRQRAELSEKTSYINGVENERKRLAKELHDGICNDILAVNIMMQTNKEEAERLLKNVGHDVRRLSHELIPPRFDNTSLAELIESFCQSVTAENGTIVKPFISTSFNTQNLPDGKAIEIYRIIQECVSNAIKYGYSKMISVTLDTCGKQGSISIINDLSPLHPISQDKPGIGKDTLKMRADALQAELDIRNDGEEYLVELKFQL